MALLHFRAGRTGLIVAGICSALTGCAERIPGDESTGVAATTLEWAPAAQPIRPAEGQPGEQFGYAVAMSGDIALVGSPIASPSANAGSPSVTLAGQATLLLLRQGEWTPSGAPLTAPQLLSNANFGFSVAVSDKSFVIGAPFSTLSDDKPGAGLAYARTRTGENWDGPLSTLEDSKPAAWRSFGWSVAAGSTTVIVGIPNDGSVPGEAAVFDWDGSAWGFTTSLKPPASVTSGDYFGYAVAFDGDTAIVSAPLNDDGSGPVGAGYVFVRSGDPDRTWVREPKRLVSAGAVANDGFGASVSLHGDWALLGAPHHNGSIGAAYLFHRDPTSHEWEEVKTLEPSAAEGMESFGLATSLGKDVAWVGAPDRVGAGAVDPFNFEQSAWMSGTSLSIPPPELEGGAFGYAVSGSGRSVLIGAPYFNDASGVAYFFGLANGAECDQDGDCSTGHCVEGVCCDAACENGCSSCRMARKATGSDGTCGPVKALGQPRATACEVMQPSSCGTSGLCDGLGNCAFYLKGTECAPASCPDNTTEDPADACDGKGQCIKTPTKACGAFACDQGACSKHCETVLDCDGHSFCDAEQNCQPTKGPGASCTDSEQCASGFCADGFCCDQACGGQCEACSEPQKEGTCVAVRGQPRGSRQRCERGSGAPCEARVCDEITTETCEGYADVETVCQLANCHEGTAKQEGKCDGHGACSAEPEIACGNYACGETTCLTTCRAHADCVGGSYCIEGRCLLGARCSADNSAAVSASGAKPCAPYKCEAGECLKACAGTEDCAEGNLFCNAETGRCEAPTATTVASSRRPSAGCATAQAPPRGEGYDWLLVAGCAALRLAHARKRKKRQTFQKEFE